jgi:hypothetical protein
VRDLAGAQGVHHEVGEAQDELGLHDLFGHHLVARVRVAVGVLGKIIGPLHVTQQEDPFPRHQDVIEKDDGVHLLEAGPQGMVKVGAA